VQIHTAEEIKVKIAFDTEPIYPQGAERLAPALPDIESQPRMALERGSDEALDSERPAA
jgi:hypothetical protein